MAAVPAAARARGPRRRTWTRGSASCAPNSARTTGRTSSATRWPTSHAADRPAWAVPSRSTINRVLARHDCSTQPGQTAAQLVAAFRLRPAPGLLPDRRHQVSLADGRPWWSSTSWTTAPALLVACHAAAAETAAGRDRRDQAGVRRVRRPGPGASRQRHRLHQPTDPPGHRSSPRFVRTVTGWGTRPINSSPYHPQTCGKVERHHQTLKKWLPPNPRRPPSPTTDTAGHLPRYYNNRRRHSALPRRATPHQAWTDAPSLGGPASPTHPDRRHPATAAPSTATGAIASPATAPASARAHAGTTVTAIRDGDHATIYNPDGQPIGHLHLDPDQELHHPHPTPDQQPLTHVPGHPLDTCLGT